MRGRGTFRRCLAKWVGKARWNTFFPYRSVSASDKRAKWQWTSFSEAVVARWCEVGSPYRDIIAPRT